MKHKNKEFIDEKIKELNYILSLYSLKKQIIGIVGAILWFVGGAIIFLNVGEFWATLIVVGSIIPLFSLKDDSVPTKELARSAVSLMNSIINATKYELDDPAGCINMISSEGNLKIYKEFVSLFPQMSSIKLWVLSTKKNI